MKTSMTILAFLVSILSISKIDFENFETISDPAIKLTISTDQSIYQLPSEESEDDWFELNINCVITNTTEFPDPIVAAGPLTVQSTVTTATGIQEVAVIYQPPGGSWQFEPMTLTATPDVYEATFDIPEDFFGTAYYFIQAIGAERIPFPVMEACCKRMEYHCPSSGAIATEFFLSEGFEVYIYGFDYLCKRREHHYNNDKQVRGDGHNEFAEWYYFNKLQQEGKVKFYGVEESETSPIFRQPLPCGKDEQLSFYREPAHRAWYQWFASDFMISGTVLDVGAGMCDGIKVMEKANHDLRCTGIEPDQRLLQLGNPRLLIGQLEAIPDLSFDYVTCVDVIEHCVKDRELFENMQRIKRKGLFITTPCYLRSRCGNPAHCREYSIPQFTNFFEPTEVWSASPDGSIHKSLLLKAGCDIDIYRDYSVQGPDNKKKELEPPVVNLPIPITKKFNNTVDGEEWAHICGVFM